MYDIVKQLIGTLPTEFEFVYIIVTLVLAMLVISFLFSVFYIPINMLRGK
jgi:ABC-type multidrug transport system permease subunit